MIFSKSWLACSQSSHSCPALFRRNSSGKNSSNLWTLRISMGLNWQHHENRSLILVQPLNDWSVESCLLRIGFRYSSLPRETSSLEIQLACHRHEDNIGEFELSAFQSKGIWSTSRQCQIYVFRQSQTWLMYRASVNACCPSLTKVGKRLFREQKFMYAVGDPRMHLRHACA